MLKTFHQGITFDLRESAVTLGKSPAQPEECGIGLAAESIGFGDLIGRILGKLGDQIGQCGIGFLRLT